MTPSFEKFIKREFLGTLITFDPGETTGFSVWKNQKLVDCGQFNTKDVKDCVLMLRDFLQSNFNPCAEDLGHHVRMEEYRIYGWKSDQHAWSTVHTIRLIGALECLCVQQGISYDMCGAGLAKTLITDVKLKDWGFYSTNQRHANDAIRHGAYFFCTPPKDSK